ncbi:MAG: hypothetical protein KJN97_11365, partial [Deltaproteobacteria bacterium]|nr:hypothetical protein [Deltaproteobacteria bacterium]
MRRIAALAAILGVAIAAGGYVSRNFEVTTDLASLVTSEGQQHRLAHALSSSALGDVLVFTVRGDTPEATQAGTRALAAQLRTSGLLSAVHAGPPDLKPSDTHEVLFANRVGLVPTREWTNENLTLAARGLKRRLSMPTGSFTRMMSTRDPLGLYFLVAAELQQNATLRAAGDVWLSQDERYGVITARVRQDADPNAAVDEIQRTLKQFVTTQAGAPSVEWTGVHRFSHFARTHIRADIERITFFVSLAIVALYLLAFRRLSYLAIGFAPTALALVCGLAVTLAVFGVIHGVALAFGATLLGISIDFATHFLTHLVVSTRTPVEVMKIVRPSLGLGAATTLVGFAGLGTMQIKAFQQIAVFSAVGIIVALMATIFLLPAIVQTPKTTSSFRSPLRTLGHVLATSNRARIAAQITSIGSIALVGAGLFAFEWTD